jgi:hypothetical protein
MRCAVLLAALGGAVTAAVACGTGATERVGEVAFDPEDSGSAVSLPDGASSGRTGPAGSGLVTGLPCDVQAVLETRCITCHTATSTTPPPLVDFATLTAMSKSDPTKSMAAVALARMKGLGVRMPPPPAVATSADEILIMEEWVAAGTPRGGVCTEPPPKRADSGAPGPVDAGLDAAPPCASGQMWTNGDQKSASMHPGRSCQGCHQQKGGPSFQFAGTVYRNGPHDIDDCHGAAPPPALSVVVTDSRGNTAAIPVNAAGNFSVGQLRDAKDEKAFRAPFSVRVTDGTTTRAMTGKLTSGDCNSCHTAAGANGAPGRILAP